MSNAIKYTFHSHTYRCGHASGDIEDYVKIAIDNGIKYYGVSDHVFLPGLCQPGTRGDFNLLDDYINVFHQVEEKYKSKIHLFLSFECEYSKVYVDYYRSLLKEKGFDYLICGQHMGINLDKSYHWYLDGEIEGFIRYKNDVIDAMKSGLFLYIAHPDLFFLRVSQITPEITLICDEIIDASIKYNVPLEFNLHGLYRKERENRKGFISYPADYFWQRVSRKDVKVIIGGDYHSPIEINNEEMPNEALKISKKYNLKLMSPKEIIERIEEMRIKR